MQDDRASRLCTDALLPCSHDALMRRIPHTARQPAHHTHTQVNTPHTRKETYVHVHTTGTTQRRMARARMATARSTLRSFQGLIESIPNMLIRDDISSRFVTRFVWGAACQGLPAVVGFSLCLPLSAPSRRVIFCVSGVFMAVCTSTCNNGSMCMLKWMLSHLFALISMLR